MIALGLNYKLVDLTIDVTGENGEGPLENHIFTGDQFQMFAGTERTVETQGSPCL